ncbi:hypothetical protein MKX01_022563 [Papaver californicum]|nr:hypothetical protein MKX01_022563 [Papaver californicum]
MKRGNSSSSSSEDRISNLSDSLIHHILSFMITKYAVQTCVLSSRWRYIWTSMPVLNFSERFHYSESNDEDSRDERLNEVFIDFVNKVLDLHDNSDIQVMHLDCSTLYINVSILYRWIEIAVSQNVQELYIKTNLEDDFEIPPCLCACKSLTKMELQLSGWDYDGYENRIILPHNMIRVLNVYRGDETLTNRFFSSFPSLESLIMEMGDRGFHNTNLYISLPKLKYSIFDCQNDESNSVVKLHAPSLASFSFDSYLSTKFTLENLSYKVPGSFDIHAEKRETYAQHTMGFLRGIHTVKVLTLKHSFLKQNYDKPPVYPFCDELVSSSNIKSGYCLGNINPENIGDYCDAGLSLPCMICQLKFVEIKSLRGCINELKFLVGENFLREKRMTKFREMLLTFPSASKNITVLCKF